MAINKVTKNITVFIVGAGASNEVNLPIGEKLKEEIVKLLDIEVGYGRQIKGDIDITDAFRTQALDNGERDIWKYVKEARHISDALPLAISIDNFIDSQRDNDVLAFCAKLAIAKAILDAEEYSKLHFKNDSIESTINFNDLSKTWYNKYFQLITENCALQDLEERLSRITMIVFNYDRCIEHYLFHAFKKYYRIDDMEAAKLVGYIKIYHPYGSVGPLPWTQQNGAVMYGEKPRGNMLVSISKKIKTFTEGTDPTSSEITEIKKSMGEANQLIFLGFAFHDLNMKLLTSSKDYFEDFRVIRCFASTYKISKSDSKVVNEQIKSLADTEMEVNIADSTCHDLFNEFWRSIAV